MCSRALHRNTDGTWRSLQTGSSGRPASGCWVGGAGHGLCIDAYGRAQPCIGVRAPGLTVALTPVGFPASGSGTDLASHVPECETGGVRLSDALERLRRLCEVRATNPRLPSAAAPAAFSKGFCEQCPAKSWTEHKTWSNPGGPTCARWRTRRRATWGGLAKPNGMGGDGLAKTRQARTAVARWLRDQTCGKAVFGMNLPAALYPFAEPQTREGGAEHGQNN